jgi:hypothetical protein
MSGPVLRNRPRPGEVLGATDPTVAPDEPLATAPDFIVQIRDNVNASPCLTDELRAVIQTALGTSFAAVFPRAYVDNACIGGPDPGQEAAAFGVWLTTPDNPSDVFKQARRAALDTDIGRVASESIAFFISTTLFEAAAAQSFPPDPPGGSIHLHPPLKLVFRSPDTIVTSLTGVDEDPTPDVSFIVTITETFLAGPRPSTPWFTSTPNLDTDATWVAVLAWVLTIPLAFSPWFLPLAFAGWYQVYEVESASSPSAQGVGSAVASLLMPLAIAIPGGKKIPIAYSLRESHHGGVIVEEGGMYVGGNLLQAVPREPSVTLSGASKVSVHIGGGDFYDKIEARPIDLRGTLRYDWTLNGQPYAATDPSITLSFNPSIGPFGTQTVAVTVTDEDGLTVSATMQVTASLQESHQVGRGDSRNPIQPA